MAIGGSAGRLGGVILVLVAATLIPGCGPKLSKEELGKVVFEVPKVPGSETPFPMPELDKGDAAPKDATGL